MTGMLWTWCRRRSALRDAIERRSSCRRRHRCTPEETLPGDQLAARIDRDDRCREPSVLSDGLRMIAPSADDVFWQVAVSALE